MDLKESDEDEEAHADADAFALVPAGMMITNTESIVDSEPGVDPDVPLDVADGEPSDTDDSETPKPWHCCY